MARYNPPIGIKLIAILTGANAVFFFFTAYLRLFRHDELFPMEPAHVTVPLTLGLGALFGWAAVDLWRLKRWAWWTVLTIYSLIFLVMCIQLVQHRIFPDPKHWWHSYLYPILFGYLLRPSIRLRFGRTRNERNG